MVPGASRALIDAGHCVTWSWCCVGLCDGHSLREGEELCQVGELKEEDAEVRYEMSYSSIG